MNKQFLEIAWKCWNDKLTSAPATFELIAEEESDWEIDNGLIQFKDEHVVLKYAAKYVYEEIITPNLHDYESIHSSLKKIWIKQISNKSLSGMSLAIAHNDRKLDLFDFAINVRKFQNSTYEFLQVIDDAVSGINHLNLDTLFDWYSSASLELNRSWNNGYLIESLIPYLKNNPDVRSEIIQRYFDKPDQSISSLYKLVLISVGQMDIVEGLRLTKEHIGKGGIEITIPAVDALSYYDFTLDAEKQLLNTTLEYVSTILNDSESEDLKGIAASTICRLVVKDFALHPYLLDLIKEDSLSVKASLAEFLLRHINQCKDQVWLEELILSCSRVSLSDTAILHHMDFVLYQCFSFDITIVERYLEQFLEYQDQSNYREIDLEEIFDSTIHTLLDSERIPYLFTKWMGSDSINLISAADLLIRSLYVNRKNENKAFEYDLTILNSLELESIHRLVLRCYGYLFDQYILLSLTWSLTKVSHNQNAILDFFEELFLKHLAYDYPKDSTEFLEGKLKENLPGELEAICHNVLQAIKSYQENLDALPSLKEMESSYSKRRFIFRERDKQMHKSRASAQRKSIISQLATTIHLKFGRSSFSVHGSVATQKMQMVSHSVSYSLPRSELIDPVGSNRMRFIYRTSFKAEE